jgi:hypothetical protein
MLMWRWPAVQMICQGPGCGRPFEAKRRTAKYCSTKCSVAASRAGKLGTPTPAAGAEPEQGAPRAQRGGGRPVVEVTSDMFASSLEVLEAAGKARTWSGQSALLLAQRLDQGGAETLSALATAITAHAAAMERALTGDNEDDPVAGRVRQAEERASLYAVPEQ